MDMRMGKTLIMVRYCRVIKAKKTLVVAPYSALGSWENELDAESLSHIMLVGSKAKRRELLQQEADFYLINKEGHLSLPEMADIHWDVVILDESSQMIRNPKTKITRYFTKYFYHVPHRWVLTGTPITEGELDLFCQMQFAVGAFMGCNSFWEFRARYFHQHNQFSWTINKSSRDKIRENLKHQAFILKRKDVGQDIGRVIEPRTLLLPDRVKKVYKECKEYFVIEECDEKYFWMVQVWQRLRQITSGFLPDGSILWDGKMNEAKSLVTGELKGENVVIWCCYRRSIQELKERIPDSRAISGSTPPSQRKSILKGFGQKYRVLILQVEVCKSGVDLGASDTAIYYETPPSYLSYFQSRDRILRMDKKSLLYIPLVVKGSVDEDVYNALFRKKVKSDLLLSKELREMFYAQGNVH